MPGRKYSAGSGYRYGFNGKENDKDAGEGIQDYGMRIYDARLGRFLSVDPLMKDYPWYTPYQFAGNKPIEYIDLDGGEEMPTKDKIMRVQNEIYSKINKINKNDIKLQLAKAAFHAFDRLDMFSIAGRDLSAYNMVRYLEGKGGYDVFSYSAIANSSVYGTFSYINRNVRRAIVKDIEMQSEILAKEKGKGTYQLTSEVNRFKGQGAAMVHDIGTAFGSFEVLGKGMFTVTIDEKGNYSYSGNIFYTFRDTYRWHPDKKLAKHGIMDEADHKKMEQLKVLGAQNFYIRAYYYQSVKGAKNQTYTDDGYMKDSPNPSNHLDTRGPSIYYSMPENTQKVNDFRKTG